MILDEWVEVRIVASNIKHYQSKGYSEIACGQVIQVSPSELTKCSDARLQVKCPTCGYEQTVKAYSYFKRKSPDNCKMCVAQATKTLDFVRNEFSKRGYTLLTDNYVNAHQHLQYVCSKHPDEVQQIIYNSLQRGSGCRHCGLLRSSASHSLTVDTVTAAIDKTPYTFVSLSPGKLTSKSVLTLYCHVHSCTFDVIYNNLQQGNGCPQCGRDRCRGKNNIFYKGTSLYLSQYLRSYLAEWKLASTRNANYICEVSGLSKAITDFDVHHTVSSKSLEDTVLRQLFGYTDRHDVYTAEDLAAMVPLYKDLHNTVAGAFIAHPVHKLFHKMYGIKDGNTPDQYLEFVSDFKKGWVVFDAPIKYRKSGKSRYKLRRLNDQTKNS